jgi:hypothetical protein
MLALDIDRALAILKKQIAAAPISSEVTLWVESTEPGSRGRPNHLARPQFEEDLGFDMGEDFKDQLRRNFAEALAEVHRAHGQMCLPLLQKAQTVAANIPMEAEGRERRAKMAEDAVQRMLHQIAQCEAGAEEARRQSY